MKHLFFGLMLASWSCLACAHGESDSWSLYKGYQTYLKSIPSDVVRRFYFKSATPQKQIALTFDDGPIANTQAIIATLAKYQVPATFFLVTGNLTASNANLYQGDLIDLGLHTHRHQDYRQLTRQQKMSDVKNAVNAFAKFNLKSSYFRPAYGVIDEELAQILQAEGLQGVLWSLDSEDWNKRRDKALVDGVLNNLHNGAIVLFHDRLSAADVDVIIQGVQSQGYDIVRLSHIMEQPSLHPYL